MVRRPLGIHVGYINEEGEEEGRKLYHHDARVFLHEMDHLNGILFVDHLSKLKQKRLKKKAEKQSKKL